MDFFDFSEVYLYILLMGVVFNSCRGAGTVVNDSSSNGPPTEGTVGVKDEVEDQGCIIRQNQSIEQCHEASLNNAQLPYYSCIGLIQFEMEGSANSAPFATGALIMDDLVLTAAHSFFYRDDLNKRCLSCEPKSFWFQFHNNLQQKVEYKVDQWIVNHVFKTMIKQCQGEKYFQFGKMLSKNMIGFDFALIKLKKPIPNVTFPKLLQNHQISDLPHSSTAILYGYSATGIAEDQNKIERAKMTNHRGSILKVTDNHFQHNLDTTPGHSGSPIFLRTKTLGGVENHYIVGVHTGHYNLGTNKYGALVSETMVEGLKLWQDDLHKNEPNNSYNICEIRQKVAVTLETYKVKFRSKPKKQLNPVKQMEASTLRLEGYKPFHFQFNTQLQQSQYYTVTNCKECKTIQRILNGSLFENQPYHFTSREPLPQQKWKISLRVTKYSKGQVIVLGFINQFLRSEQQSSGFIKQPQCVSLWLCEESDQMQKTGIILIDGELWIRSNEAFLEKDSILTIYGDIPSRKLDWVFPSGTVFQSPIPESIFANNAKMHFFVGLNNTQQIIEIINE